MKTQTQYAVLHIEKGQGTDNGMSAHIERSISPGNVDSTLTHLNEILVKYPDGVENRSQAIQHRTENAGIKRKIAKNQVKVLRVMLSGTHEQMKELENTGRLGEWTNENMRWLKETFGEQNVVAAHLHLDEKTPHIHASIVPIVSGKPRKSAKNKKKITANPVRLCADDIMTRPNLENLQDIYAEAMKPFGLERGIKGSEAKHISTAEHYRQIYLELKKLRKEKQISKQQHEEILQQIKTAKSSKAREELKNSISEMGTNVAERLGSFFDSSGRKQRDEKIADLEKKLVEKDKSFAEMQNKLNNDFCELRDNYEKNLDLHIKWQKMVVGFVPFLFERLRIAEICKKMFRLEISEVKKILWYKRKFTGQVVNPNNNETYTVEELDVKMTQSAENPKKLELRLDDIEHTEWLNQKAEQRKQRIALRPPQQTKRSGMKM